MLLNESITLTNGVRLPKVGLGTWFIGEEQAEEVVKQAVAIGYRHFDTAQAYGNEIGVGQGIRNCGVAREELFVTSKVAAEHKTFTSALDSINRSLKTMGLDYIDMMIIHSPQPWAEVNQSENRYFEENKQVWRALEAALKDGKVNAIGVSNFMKEDIDSLWESASVKPMVNQVLCHISNTPLGLIQYCQDKGIVMEAYSPVAHGEALKNDAIKKIAAKYNVSVPQLCIRYDLQLGVVVIPKTTNPEHLRTNTSLDFEISEEDMKVLTAIPKIKDYGEFSRFPVFGGKK